MNTYDCGLVNASIDSGWAVAVTAFDTLFWLLIVMLGVVAYAIEAGIATRHRTAVLGTMALSTTAQVVRSSAF